MNKNKALVWLVCLGAVILPAGMAMALDNENRTIRQVEITSNQLLLHLHESTTARPGCARYASIVGCSMSDGYCEQAVKIALAAQMSGRAIDLELDGTCVSGVVTGVSRFVRIRTDQ